MAVPLKLSASSNKMTAIVFWSIFLSLWIAVVGKTCTKLSLLTYEAYSMNKYTQRLTPMTKYRKRVDIVCCEGYQEIGRTYGSVQPNCVPICSPPCSGGRVCSAPNTCSCANGYELDKSGECVETFIGTNTKDKKHHLKDYDAIPTTLTVDKSTYTTAKKSHFIGFAFVATTPISIEIPPRINVTHTTKKPALLRTTIGEDDIRSKTCEMCNEGTCIRGKCICRTGYKLIHEGTCQPVCTQSCLHGQCVAPNSCRCLDGYSYDSESSQCRPLCNGKMYGCVHGTCVGYNQCRCDNGTTLNKDEEFHCSASELLQQKTYNWLWYILLLVVSIVVVAMSFYIIISRWKKAKENRIEGQAEYFSEVRFNNPRNDHPPTDQYYKAYETEEPLLSEPSSTRGTIRSNGKILVINT